MGCAGSSLSQGHAPGPRHGEFLSCFLAKLHGSPSTLTQVPLPDPGSLAPLHAACKGKHIEEVRAVLSFLSSSDLPTAQWALQQQCRAAGLPPPASLADAARIAVNAADSKGRTPLMYACQADSPALVELLLAWGADPWATDRCVGRTALHHAAAEGAAAAISALVRCLPDHLAERQGVRYVNATTQCGLTPLHYAAHCGHVGAAARLLALQPHLMPATRCLSYDSAVGCEAGSTPLHVAAARGHTDVARAILQHYADTHAPSSADPRLRCDANRQLPHQLAAAHRPPNPELVALLHPGRALHPAAPVVALGPEALARREGRGPEPLRVVAAAALRAKLLWEVREAGTGGQQREAELQGGKGRGSEGRGSGGGRMAAPGEAVVGTAATAVAGIVGDGCGRGAAEGCGVPGPRPEACGGVGEGQQPSQAAARARVEVQAEVEVDEIEGAGGGSGAGSPRGCGGGACDVCFARRQEVASSVCGHGVCCACAEALCRAMGQEPLRCPFCRQVVTGFVPRR